MSLNPELKFYRKHLAFQLHPELKPTPGLSVANQVVVLIICVSILTGILETEASLAEGFRAYFQTLHVAFLMLFLIEYSLRVYTAAENPNVTSRISYMLSPTSIADLLVIISFIMPFVGSEAVVLRILRLFRLVRLARLGRFSLAMQRIFQALVEKRFELGMSVIIATSLLLLSSTMLYIFERAAQPEEFGSIPRAMWWSVATLTTVGYGDVVPLTLAGRLFAAITAITGIGIIAIPTGILASAFADAMQRNRSEDPD